MQCYTVTEICRISSLKKSQQQEETLHTHKKKTNQPPKQTNRTKTKPKQTKKPKVFETFSDVYAVYMKMLCGNITTVSLG